MNTIDLTQFFEKTQNLADKEIILDVRNPDEYSEGHIKGSLNIPLPQLETKLSELKDYSAIYIHCKRGGRAQKAYELLSSNGVENLVCLAEFGFDHWGAQGYPINS
jgi:phage shock protein E